MAPPGLRIVRESTNGGALLKLEGVLDESFPRAELGKQCARVTVFDFAGVSRITSFGVREWIAALRELSIAYYAFVNCRPSIVSQFNMVPRFGGAGELVSFYAPYVCPECSTETEALIDLRKDYAVILSGEPPETKCAKCGAIAEFDELPQSYFGYAAGRPKPTLPKAAERLIDGEVESSRPLSVRKEVSGVVTALWLSGELDGRVRFKRLLDGIEGDVAIVLGGVTASSDEGRRRLLELSRTAGSSLTLARMPVALARELPTDVREFCRARVASFSLRFDCPACKTASDLEIDKERWLQSQVTKHVDCGHCKAPIPFDGQALVDLRASELFGVPPAATRKYLDSNRNIERLNDVDSVASVHSKAAPPASGYELGERIGVGGTAEVFLAYRNGPEGFRKTVVLKKSLPEFDGANDFAEMLLHEARMVARISHPNVVQTLDLGMDNGAYFVAMEYVRGHNLHQIISTAKAASTPIPMEIACRVIADACAGLHAAHICESDEGEPLGIVHRDVSPHNILVSDDGIAKVADFGVAKVQSSNNRTEPGTIKGKLSYMSPEQISDGEAIDRRADIFAIGIVFYECLFGSNPFRKRTEMGTIQAILTDPMPPIPDTATPELRLVLERAIARAPDARYATAQEMQTAIEAALSKGGKPTTAIDVAEWLRALYAKPLPSRVALSDAAPGSDDESDPDLRTRTSRIPLTSGTWASGGTARIAVGGIAIERLVPPKGSLE